MPDKTVDQLIEEHQSIKNFITKEQARFDDHIRPHKTRMEEILSALHSLMHEQGCDSFSTEHGTAYISRIMNLKVENREALLDFCNSEWESVGNELLLISAQKDAVKRYQEENGTPPPGIKIDWFNRVNIRKS